MGRPTLITGPLAALVEHAGGVEALARALGVSRLTVYRWGTGAQVPSAIVQGAVNAWASRRGIAAPF